MTTKGARARIVLGSLAGGLAIHVAMAACSSSGTASPSARAAPPVGTFAQIEISEEPCSVVFGNRRYAEHAYPGVSAVELSQRVWIAVKESRDPTSGGTNSPPGYVAELDQEKFLVKDGSVAVHCGESGTDTAIFHFAK